MIEAEQSYIFERWRDFARVARRFAMRSLIQTLRGSQIPFVVIVKVLIRSVLVFLLNFFIEKTEKSMPCALDSSYGHMAAPQNLSASEHKFGTTCTS